MATRKADKTTTAAPKTGRSPRPPWLLGIPEYEAIEAARSNLSPEEAVRRCAYLSAQYRKRWRTMANVEINLDQILHALRAKKVPFVLTGAHGIAGWTGRVRSTHDIDILVKSGRNHARAVKALKDLYPQLEVRALAGVTAFFVAGEKESVIDVTIPHRPDIAETLRTAIAVEDRGLKYRVPTLEAALANKYGAMLALTRDVVKRAQDVVDFSWMVKHSSDEGRQPIDLETLAALGEKVWPGGGGQEILRIVALVQAGTIPTLKELHQLP